MGHRPDHYVILAADLGFDNVEYDDVESEIDGEGEFDVIYDGMSGNYVYAGKILVKADRYEGFDDTDIGTLLDEGEGLDDIMQKVMLRYPHVTVDDFKLRVFTHWH